jgi:hypothetical protein
VLSCSEAERGKRREKREKVRFGVRSQLVRTLLSVDAAHERAWEGGSRWSGIWVWRWR